MNASMPKPHKGQVVCSQDDLKNELPDKEEVSLCPRKALIVADEDNNPQPRLSLRCQSTIDERRKMMVGGKSNFELSKYFEL